MGTRKPVDQKFDVAMCIPGDLSELPRVVAGIPIVVVSIDIAKHTVGQVATMLRDIRRRTGARKQSVFLTIDGYDDDSREIYSIPEACAWAEGFIFDEPDALAFLADERECQKPDAPMALQCTSKDAIGRAKLCVLAGLGKMEKKNDGTGEHLLMLDSAAVAGLDIIASAEAELAQLYANQN